MTAHLAAGSGEIWQLILLPLPADVAAFSEAQ